MTLAITVVSVAIEFVLGMALALVMHRTIFGKGVVRTAILIPYGIVTVAASYSWYYAWTPGTGYLANLLPEGSAPLTEQIPSLAIVVLAEVWKTTPFMALLLLAGLALVPQDLLNAAQIDGAGAWKRLTKIILPLIKPAILVALLFRTLDAFRIFDNIYVLTGGANDTGSVSILGYDNLFKAFNLGLGSAISVLIFLIGGGDRVHLHQALRRVGARRGRGRSPMTERVSARPRDGLDRRQRPGRRSTRCSRCCGSCRLSLKPTSTVKDGKLIPSQVTFDNYKGIFPGNIFTSALVNSIGIGLITTVIAVVVGGMAAYAIARLTFPGKRVLVGRRAADRDVPADLAGDTDLQHRAQDRAVRHVARPDHSRTSPSRCRWRSTPCRRSSRRSHGIWRRRRRWTAPRPARRSAR